MGELKRDVFLPVCRCVVNKFKENQMCMPVSASICEANLTSEFYRIAFFRLKKT